MTLIERFITATQSSKSRVAIVGDVIVDEYYDVSATRISPEFPIPVMTSENQEPTMMAPGGAANVCHQFSHWNVEPSLHSMCDTAAYKAIRGELGLQAVQNLINCDPGYCPRKRRFYDGKHPSFRWDIEKPNFGLSNWDLAKKQSIILNNFKKSSIPNVVILSDYNKGMFANLSENCYKFNGVPTVVDPKKTPLSKWEGCTIFKPNNIEAKALSGLSDWKDQCMYFFSQLDCNYVVITQGGNGVVGMNKLGTPFIYESPYNLSAESVIGAGDCFIAFLALAWSLGFSIAECAEIAFTAGATYVQRDRNQPIEPYNLLKTADPLRAKRFVPDQRKGKLVFTNGCFDLLHSGHIETLLFAKSKGDKLMVGLNSDESVRRLKGDSRPIVSQDDRLKALEALECVDYVAIFDEDTPAKLIEQVKPDVIVKGSQYEARNIVGFDMVKEVHLAPMKEGFSTTKLLEKIKSSAV